MKSRSLFVAALLFSPGPLFAEDLTQFRDAPAPEDSILRASDEEVRQAVDALREKVAQPPWRFHTPTLQPSTPTPEFFNPEPYSLYGDASGPAYARPGQVTRQARLPVDHLLLQKAFELERVAHELELSGLFDEAEAVRRSAGSLRTSSKGLDGKPGESKTAASDPTPAPEAELPEPAVELLQYVPSAQPAPQPQAYVQPQPAPPQRATQRPPSTPRQQATPPRSRQSPSTQQRQRSGEQNSPNTARQRSSPQNPPERSLLFRRRGRR